jgi:hypothetical protein
METEGSLLCWKQPATESCLEHNKFLSPEDGGSPETMLLIYQTASSQIHKIVIQINHVISPDLPVIIKIL